MNRIVIAAVLALTLPRPSHGQAVQAVQQIREATEEQAQMSNDSIAFKLAERLGIYRYIHAALTSHAGAVDIRDQLDRVIDAGDRALKARRDVPAFREAVRQFNELEQAMLGRPQELTTSNIAPLQTLGTYGPLGLPVPQSHVIVKDVVFTIGPEAFLAKGSDFVGSAGLSTNLLGAGVGAVFDVFGSDDLKEYFANNLTAGTSIPFEGPGKLSAQIGVGLGGINLDKVTIWPVLNVESLDSEDERLPSALTGDEPDEEQWSSPIVSVAIVPFSNSELRTRLQKGGFVPIPVVGFRAPFYYPGNPFSTVAAIFTDNRNDFVRTGPVQFILGVSVPLLRVDTPDPD